MRGREEIATALLSLVLVSALTGCGSPATVEPTPEARFSALAGRYAQDRYSLLEVEAHGDLISVVPPFWTSKPYFATEDGETFSMRLPSPRPGRTVIFSDFEATVPATVTLSSIDRNYDGSPFRRLPEGEPTVADLLLAGDIPAAADLALAEPVDPDEVAGFALVALLSYRSTLADTTEFLRLLTMSLPGHARLRSLYGHGLVAVGRREAAQATFVEALQLDPEDWTAVEGLRRLRFEEPLPDTGYRKVLPFKLAEAYAPPTADEVARVREVWASRDLEPRAVAVVANASLTLAGREFEILMIRHRVAGNEHYGALFVPRGVPDGRPLPIVIDARGVNSTYTPLDISNGTKTLRAFAPLRTDFAFLVPGFRGNTLILDDVEYVASGDASDAWDGATDDALAFLAAAQTTMPELDGENVAIVGYSRGGTVALLAGIRDPRIDLVLDVAGPVDHFVAMNDSLGWTKAEILADALRGGTVPEPTQEGGQVFDHFFDRVVDGETLDQVRLRMIASSPLYFVESLPETHAYYGAEDRSVPKLNAEMLERRMDELGRVGRDFTLRLFDRRGHDTDPLLVQRATAERLAEWAAGSGR